VPEARRELYSVDTSSFMDWQDRYYPTDVFGSLSLKLESLVQQARFVAPRMVREELDAVASPDLVGWAKKHPKVFVPNPEVLAETLSIQGKFPGLRDPKAQFDEADAYVIALARIRQGVVVTQETPAAEKRKPARTHYIPDVCRELGITCVSLLGLMRREGWKI
jgi:hypothetical protein